MSRPASDEKSTDPVDYKTILDSLADLNVPGDKNWCSKPGTGNTFYSCVPEILRTKDGSEPFRCLRKIGNEHGVIGSGAFGEVMKYQRKNRGQTEEIAIKVLAQKGFFECQDNPPYYTPEECNPYLVLQRCITPASFKCYETKLEVKVLAMEPMETTLDEFLTKYTDFGEEETEITLTFKDKRKILEKIWKALKCVWEHGGVYTDMKGANVGVNPNSENLGESVIKLIDLGSICHRGTQSMNYTFAPPQKWKLFQYIVHGPGAPTLCSCNRYRDECSEITLIWSFVVAALIVLDFYSFISLGKLNLGPVDSSLNTLSKWSYTKFPDYREERFDQVNKMMADIRKNISYIIHKDIAGGEDWGYLNWLTLYFRPYRINKEDWRSDSTQPIPERMKFKNIWKEVIKKGVDYRRD